MSVKIIKKKKEAILMHMKLTSWKTNNLFFAGRITRVNLLCLAF